MTQRSKDDLSKKRVIRDILAYEDTITVEVEKTVQTIRRRAKLLQNELDRYVTSMLNQLKRRFERELQKIRYAVDKLKAGKDIPGKVGSLNSSLDRPPR